MMNIHLPASIKFLAIPEILTRTAAAVLPADTEERTPVALYQIEMQHAQALRAAIKQGTIKALDRLSFCRVPDSEGGAYPNAVITRADFEQFAKSLSIDVDSDVAETVDPLNEEGSSLEPDRSEAAGQNVDAAPATLETQALPIEETVKRAEMQSAVKFGRQDALALELDEILKRLRADKQRPTATAVFAKLKEGAGKGGCVVDVTGDGSSLMWERTTGKNEQIAVRGIQQRIGRWKKKNHA